MSQEISQSNSMLGGQPEVFQRSISRRNLFRQALRYGAGIGGATLIGCGDPSEVMEPGIIPTNPPIQSTPESTSTPMATSTEIPTVLPTEVPTPEPTSEVELTLEQRIQAFADEIGFNLDTIQEPLNFNAVEQEDIKYYSAFKPGEKEGSNITVSIQESIKSERFEEDGRPLIERMGINYLEFEMNDDIFDKVIFEHFPNLLEQSESQELVVTTIPEGELLVGESTLWEKIWDNPDGTKTSVYVIKGNFRRGGGSVPVTAVLANKIYADYPYFDLNTAYPPQE